MKILILLFLSVSFLPHSSASNQRNIYLGIPIEHSHVEINKNVYDYELIGSDKQQGGLFKRVRKSFQNLRSIMKIKKKRDKGNRIFGILTLINLGISVLLILMSLVLANSISGVGFDDSGFVVLGLLLLGYAFFLQTLAIVGIWIIYFLAKLIITYANRRKRPKKKKNSKKKKEPNLLL